MDRQRLLDNVSAALARLSSPAALQIEYLGVLGVDGSLDELALEFDGMYLPARVIIEGFEGSTRVLAACDAVSAALRSEGLGWDSRDLESLEWSRLRILAGDARELPDGWRSNAT